MAENNKTPNQVNEPNPSYNHIKVFSSFEEAAESEYNEWAARTPLQRLADTTELIKRCFHKELENNPIIGNRIYFSK
jgi:hypothetical protein